MGTFHNTQKMNNMYEQTINCLTYELHSCTVLCAQGAKEPQFTVISYNVLDYFHNQNMLQNYIKHKIVTIF